MNKREQTFCTWLRGWLIKTKPDSSMLIEAKVEDTGSEFHTNQIRKSQLGTLNRLDANLPIAHKISDGGVGSKLVDIVYISPGHTGFKGMVAVHFMQSKTKYLFPYVLVMNYRDNGETTIPEGELKPYRVC